MKLRLLKIVMQPIFVVDDGTTLTERTGEPFTVTAAEVPHFADKWNQDFAALQQQFESQAIPQPPVEAKAEKPPTKKK